MLRVAVIGAGHWGPNLIRNFHNRQSSEVLRVVDRDQARLGDVRKRFPDVAVSGDPRDAFDDPRVEAVIVATPTVTHYGLVKDGLRAGKHVLVEKPITADVGQGEELCAIAAELRRVLLVGHVFAYNAAVQYVHDRIASGDLGRVYYLSSVRTNLGPIRLDVNAAWDLAAQDISIVNLWLDRNPVSASAVGGRWLNPGIEDAVFATLRYPDDILLNLHVSWLSPRKAREMTVIGDRRMLTYDDMNLSEPLRIYDKQVTEARVRPAFVDTFASFRASVRDGDILIPRVALGEPLKAECEHFIDCVQNGTKPLTDGPAAVQVVRALDAIARSIRGAGAEERV